MDQIFERFFKDNYNNLPKWVDKELFKADLKLTFLKEAKDALEKGDTEFAGGLVLYPLIGDTIDMGANGIIDNYAFFWEHPEHMIKITEKGVV